MPNLRQAIAASESLRSKFLRGKPFSEEDVRMELAPSEDLRKQLDEAMQLILALTARISQMVRERHVLEGDLAWWKEVCKLRGEIAEAEVAIMQNKEAK